MLWKYTSLSSETTLKLKGRLFLSLNNCSYCIRIYSQADSAPNQSRKDSALHVFHTLLTLYLLAKPTLLTPALDILAQHSPRLDAGKALSLIPSEIPMDKLESFFTKHIRKETSALNEGRIVAELRKVELLRIESSAMRLRGKKAVVEEVTACPYCHKRLGQSVIAVLPEYGPFCDLPLTSSGSMTHYSCLRNFLKERNLDYKVQ